MMVGRVESSSTPTLLKGVPSSSSSPIIPKTPGNRTVSSGSIGNGNRKKKLPVLSSPSPSPPKVTSTPISSSSSSLKGGKSNLKMKGGVVIHHCDKEVQTDHPDLALITGDEPPPEYWKRLAESRRQALEDTLSENEKLHKRIEELEEENQAMEEMVQQAKTMAELINSLGEEDSGIAGVGGDDDEDEDVSLLEEKK